MSRRLTRKIVVAAVSVAAVLGGAGTAQAAPPTIERITVDDSFVDEFFSEECGVAVTLTAIGRITVRTFDREGPGPLELVTVNVGLTLSAGDNTVRLRDVGSDMVRRTPDGTVVLRVSGQVPFAFTGTLTLDLTTGEVILEPRRTQQIEDVCAALTG